MSEQDDTDDRPSMGEAFDELREAKGQSYLRATDAWELIAAFGREVTAEYLEDSGVLPDGADAEEAAEEIEYVGMALSEDLEDIQRSGADARGIVSVWPHEMLVTYSDVSDIVARAVGGQSSEYTAGGAGFTADGRHDDNVQTIADTLNLLPGEA